MAIIEQEREQEIAPVERDYPVEPSAPEIDRDGYSELGKVMLDAADLIISYGWVQHESGDFEHGFCAIGAIHKAFRTGRCYTDFQGAHRGLIRDLVKFNDAPRRDPWEVVARLRELAKSV